MKRFSILLLLIVGCAEASGGIHPFGVGRTTSAQKQPAKEVAAVAPAPDPAVIDMQRRAAAAAPLAARPLYSAADPAERHLVLPPVIEGEVDDWITIKPDTNYPVVKYISLDRGLKVFPSGMLSSHVDTVVEAKAAGDYRMAAIAADGDEPTDPFMFIVRVGHAPQPPPGPGPGPGPKPPGPGPAPPPGPGPEPPPAPTQAFNIVWIYNAAAATPPIVKFNDIAYWNRLKAAGHSFWLIDSNNTAQTAGYKSQLAAAGGIPFVIIMDSNRKTLAAVQAPKDATGKPIPSQDWLNSILATLGGKPPAGK